jgi:charged multivesicular body protein 1
MDKFESQFEDLDVQSQYMENAMAGTTTITTPQDEVDSLMHQVADQYGLELNAELANVPTGKAAVSASVGQEQDELTERLAKLRNA